LTCNCFSVLRRGSKEVAYLRLVDFCITHLYAESNKEEEEEEVTASMSCTPFAFVALVTSPVSEPSLDA